MLLILLIVAIVTLFAARIILYQMAEHEEKNFFEQLHADIYFAQSYALAEAGRVRVNFYGDNGYEISVQGEVIKVVPYPKTVSYIVTQQFAYIEFTDKGSISRILKHSFARKNKKNYEITFHLGKGRHGISM